MKSRRPLTGILFIFVGIIALIWGGIVLKNASASSAWPSVQGEVTESKVETKVERVKKNERWQNRRTYWAKVHYSYSVDGAPYSGAKVSFGEYGGKEKDARQIVKRFPKGKSVDVYYDPEKPEMAVLEPGATKASYLFLGIGLVSFIVGIAAYLAPHSPKVNRFATIF